MREITVDEAREHVLDAMAEPSRLRILSFLLRRGEATVSELVDFLKMDQPGVSHHLRCLRNCGLVETQKEGRYVRYSLNGSRRVQRILELIDGHAQQHLESILDCEIVEEEHGTKPRH